jgi:hypothetical protein
VPSSVWLLLMIVSATVCWCTGQATGVSAGERLGMSLLLLPLLVTIVIHDCRGSRPSSAWLDYDKPGKHAPSTSPVGKKSVCRTCGEGRLLARKYSASGVTSPKPAPLLRWAEQVTRQCQTARNPENRSAGHSIRASKMTHTSLLAKSRDPK